MDIKYMWSQEYRIAVFDITRAAAEHSDHLCSMAEALKDGNFVSTKYQTCFKVFPRPHVVFFSNQLYDADKWSRDRVKLVDLDNNYNHLPAMDDGIVYRMFRERSRSPVHPAATAANRAFNEEVQLPADPFDQGLVPALPRLAEAEPL